MILKIEDLSIDGFDLINIGVKPGPVIGKILQILLFEVIENPYLNTKKDLIERVKKILHEMK
jgi:tRNA nucleotidyltransferase (CCA-adding enzyme)